MALSVTSGHAFLTTGSYYLIFDTTLGGWPYVQAQQVCIQLSLDNTRSMPYDTSGHTFVTTGLHCYLIFDKYETSGVPWLAIRSPTLGMDIF